MICAKQKSWMGKALILLSDNYLGKEDVFQAKATLKGVIKNSKFPELVTTASDKLKIIENAENAKRVMQQPEENNIELFNDSTFKKLFKEDEVIKEDSIPRIKQTKK